MTERKNTYTKADLAALNEIVVRLKNKVNNNYNNKLLKPKTEKADLTTRLSKEFTTEIESAIMDAIGDDYGFKKVPVCRVGASKYDVQYGMVTVSFYVPLPDKKIREKQSEINNIEKVRDAEYKKIEKWEMDALQFIASRKIEQGGPAFPDLPVLKEI